jgi:hypothetical protein
MASEKQTLNKATVVEPKAKRSIRIKQKGKKMLPLKNWPP